MARSRQQSTVLTSEPGVGLVRAYRRRTVVEAEIRALPPPANPAALVAAVAEARAPETIVYALRQLLRAGASLCHRDAVFEILIKKAAPLLTEAARLHFPCSLDDRMEVIQRVSIQMWHEVTDLSPTQEFWEVFFARMINYASADAAYAIRHQRRQERFFVEGTNSLGDPWREEDLLPDSAPELDGDRLLVLQVLDRLPDPVQTVVRLRLQGLQEASKDPNLVTISSLLGITDRTVRSYLRKGEQQLREWLT